MGVGGFEIGGGTVASGVGAGGRETFGGSTGFTGEGLDTLGGLATGTGVGIGAGALGGCAFGDGACFGGSTVGDGDGFGVGWGVGGEEIGAGLVGVLGLGFVGVGW